MNTDNSPPSTPEPNLSGSIILADPSLRDPSFFRTVLILTDHGKQSGARGYVLNRPIERTVGDFLSAKEFSEVWEVPVFSGGPVAGNELTFISFNWNGPRNRIQWSEPLGLQGAKKMLTAGDEVRGFLGYAGWTAGQLEDEIQRKAWIRRAPPREVLDTEAGEELWTRLLAGMGPFYQLLAKTPVDPGLN